MQGTTIQNALLSVLLTFHTWFRFINGQESANKIYPVHKGMLTNNAGILESALQW